MLTKKDIYKEKFRFNIEKLLYALVFILIFEGLIRKLLPSAVGIIIFFLKDIFCIVGLIFITNFFAKNTIQNNPIYVLRKFFFIVILPPLINTNFKDPVIAIFGLKQYMLYMVIGLLIPLAFTPDKIDNFKKFIFYITLTIIPTTMVAVLQNSLPGSHWLNRSVDGGSLEAFSAGGLLRVSSTFAFTGQYSWYLNVLCVILATNFCLPMTIGGFLNKKTITIISIFIGFNFIIGAFITGGRTAVLGSGLAMLLGFLLAIIKSPQKIIARGFIIIIILSLSLIVIREVKPEFFLVYDLRSKDGKKETENEEIGGRVFKDLFGWTEWIADQDVIPFLFGNGLGVMSNGADKLSGYARSIRDQGITTESEIDSVAWEGGMYTVIVWFGMRIWVIIKCFSLWRKVKDNNTSIAVSFLLSYIIIVGLYGALSRQPPIAIWWWIAIGSVITLHTFDKNKIKDINI